MAALENWCSQITAFQFLQLKWELKSTSFTELLGLHEIIHVKSLALWLVCGTYRIMHAVRRYIDITGNGSLKDGVNSILLYVYIIIHLPSALLMNFYVVSSFLLR